MITGLDGRTVASGRRASRAADRRPPSWFVGRWALIGPGLVAVALLSLLYLNQASDVATVGYDVDSLEAQKQDWETRNQQLQLQIDELSSLDHVAGEAQRRLGMAPPSRVVYVTPTTAPAGPTVSPVGAGPARAPTPTFEGRAASLLRVIFDRLTAGGDQ